MINQSMLINSFISHVLLSPDKLKLVLCHYPPEYYVCNKHKHNELMQLDLLLGFKGKAYIDSKQYDINPFTALCIYPGQEHGYELTNQNDGCVFSIKLKTNHETLLDHPCL